MKALIVYYSLTGKTELVAKAIGEALDAELRKVEELRKRGILFAYLSGLINAMRGAGSKVKPMDFNIESYDMVFIGTPVWAFKPAPAINTFISKTDFESKKVVLFVTMGWIGDKSAIKIMKDAVESKGGKVINSFAVRTGGVKDERIIRKGMEIGRQYKI